MLTVTVKPPNREEYALTIIGAVQFTSAQFGGYEMAEVTCEPVSDDLRGAKLRIHGVTGIVWQGFVTRRPTRTDPLIARGWGWCATFGRREASYVDTSMSAWKQCEDTAYNKAWHLESTADKLKMVVNNGDPLNGTNGVWRELPTTTSAHYHFGWSRGWVDYDAIVFCYGTTTDGTEPSSWSVHTTVASAGSGAATGTADITVDASHNAVKVYWTRSNAANASADIVSRYISSPKVYGVPSVTTVTTHTVFDDIIDNEVAVAYLPAGAAYRAWIEAEATALEPLTFTSTNAESKIAELTKYAAFDYGWYCEYVAGSGSVCVPHWSGRPTTPTYILNLTEAESSDIDECALDELVSAMRISYSRPDGYELTTTVTDTDPTHPLVAAGITLYGDLDVHVHNQLSAQNYGNLALADRGRNQSKGNVTTRKLADANGAPVYLPDARPGKMLRLYGVEGGFIDAIVKRVSCTGDELVTLELDNDGYSLDIALAKLASATANG